MAIDYNVSFQVESKGKLSWALVRQMPHDRQYKVGDRVPGIGRVVAVGTPMTATPATPAQTLR